MTTHRIEHTEEVLADVVLSPARPKLVLSPHLDDALLSTFAVISGGPCEVWTVFAGQPRPAQTTSWDLSCGFPDSDATMTARVAEDEAAFAGTVATVRRLPALDGAYTTPSRRQADLVLIRSELEAWMQAHPDGIVIAPVGAGLHVPPAWWQRAKSRLETSRRRPVAVATTEDPLPLESAERSEKLQRAGSPSEQDAPAPETANGLKGLIKVGEQRLSDLVKQAMHADAQRRRRKVLGGDGLAANPDHLDVRDLVMDVAQNHSSIHVVLFEDLPYLWHEEGDSEAARVSKTQSCTLRRVRLPVDQEAKFAHLAPYTSQMPVMDGAGRLLQASTLPSTENYWVVSR